MNKDDNLKKIFYWKKANKEMLTIEFVDSRKKEFNKFCSDMFKSYKKGLKT